jgi:hypothetical protein
MDSDTHPSVRPHRDAWIRVRSPGLQTVTAAADSHALVGLHVDSWNRQDLGISRRGHAPNRVCLNLGSEDRFFLFVNVPVGQMYELTKGEDRQSADACSPSSIASDFMSSFPSYPVVRLRVRPGEAYVAPTENVVHDGSSIDMKGMDVTLSVRGHFGLCSK